MTIKKKISISILFLIFSSILIVSFIIYPLFSEIEKVSQEFLVQKQGVGAIEKKVENLEKFKTIFPEISADLEKIDNLFVIHEAPIGFILFLEKISRDSQVSLKISSGPAFRSEKILWPYVSFNLDLKGFFPDISNFLEKMESSPYLIEIQTLTVSRMTESELRSPEFENFFSGDAKANLLIKVYTK